MSEEPIQATVSLSRRVNLGNYESADVFLSVKGVTIETTQEEIDALLSGPVALAYRSVATALNDKCQEAKNERLSNGK